MRHAYVCCTNMDLFVCVFALLPAGYIHVRLEGTLLTKNEKTAYSNGSMAATTTTHTVLIIIMAHCAQYYQGQARFFAMSIFFFPVWLCGKHSQR
jgi:hypothetical protein